MEQGEGWGPALTFIVRRALPLTPSLPPPGVAVPIQLRLLHAVLGALC